MGARRWARRLVLGAIIEVYVIRRAWTKAVPVGIRESKGSDRQEVESRVDSLTFLYNVAVCCDRKRLWSQRHKSNADSLFLLCNLEKSLNQ